MVLYDKTIENDDKIEQLLLELFVVAISLLDICVYSQMIYASRIVTFQFL